MFNMYNLLLQSIADVGNSTEKYAGFGDTLGTMYWGILILGVVVSSIILLGAIMYMAKDDADQAGVADKVKSTALSVGFIMFILLGFSILMSIWLA